MVKIITAAGGTTSPSTFPRLNENPDPMLSERPPWVAENCNGVDHKDKDVGWAGHNKLFNLLRKNSNSLENNHKIENVLLDGTRPATAVERIKICLSSILSRKNKNIAMAEEKNSELREDDKKEQNSYFKKRRDNLKNSFSNLLNRKHKKKNRAKDKKTFAKIWLQDARGQSLKLYTFRKEE